MTKAEVRKIYLRKQKSLSAYERSERNLHIATRFFERFDLTKMRFLHTFLSIAKNGEVETLHIRKRLWKEFPEITTVAPRVDFQTMTLENRLFDAATSFVENVWGIPEPSDGETVAVEKIDVCLVPLLGFDEKGFRVGYGKGFYDRFLSECRPDCLKIGLSYFEPTTKIANVQKFDVKLDFCVTPQTVFGFKK